MVTAEELTVAIRSEGVGETKDQLEGVEDSMEETAESAGESADELGDFSERFKGAMSAAVAALAVGAAGLLAQVPVLGESFAGLAAIVSALAFQVDGVLRPVLGPITQLMFKLSAAIFEADGAAGALIGTITTIGSIAAITAGTVGTLFLQFGLLEGAFASLIAIGGIVVNAIVAIAGALTATTAALAVAAAAVVGFAAAYLTNWRGVRDKTNAIIGQILDTVVGGMKSLATQAISGLETLGSRSREILSSIASEFSTWASDVASDARDWGANLIQKFIAGIRSVLDRLRGFLQDLREVGAEVGVNVPDLPSFGGGGGGGGGGNGRGGMPGTGAGGFDIMMDGRRQTESTGRYRSDPANRRGL